MAETRGSTQLAMLSILAVEEDGQLHTLGVLEQLRWQVQELLAHIFGSLSAVSHSGLAVGVSTGLPATGEVVAQPNQPTQIPMRRQEFKAGIAAGEWKFRRVPQRFRFVLMRDYDPAV